MNHLETRIDQLSESERIYTELYIKVFSILGRRTPNRQALDWEVGDFRVLIEQVLTLTDNLFDEWKKSIRILRKEPADINIEDSNEQTGKGE